MVFEAPSMNLAIASEIGSPDPVVKRDFATKPLIVVAIR